VKKKERERKEKGEEKGRKKVRGQYLLSSTYFSCSSLESEGSSKDFKRESVKSPIICCASFATFWKMRTFV
jgi:hypothetical protein